MCARTSGSTAAWVVGYGDFAEKLEERYPDVRVGSPEGPTLAEDFRERRARHEALYEAARALDENEKREEYERDFAELDEEEAIEQAAQRRAAFLRREERIRQRTLELLENEENE